MKIAICGKMCSGKSTLANHIMRQFDGYQIYSFGQKVKELCVELFNMKHKDRTLLINFANKMRDIDPDVWINQVLKQTSQKQNCILDDVRYQNEVDALIRDGWKIIHLQVPLHIQKQRIMKLYPNNYQDHLDAGSHISEQNQFIFPEGYPNMILDTSDHNMEQIKHDINMFILKQ